MRITTGQQQEWSPPISTALLIENLSLGRGQKLSWEVEQLFLRRVVETRICTLCDADHGELCLTYGGPPNLRRTHPIRLRMGRAGRTAALEWALNETARRAAEADEVEADETVA